MATMETSKSFWDEHYDQYLPDLTAHLDLPDTAFSEAQFLRNNNNSDALHAQYFQPLQWNSPLVSGLNTSNAPLLLPHFPNLPLPFQFNNLQHSPLIGYESGAASNISTPSLSAHHLHSTPPTAPLVSPTVKPMMVASASSSTPTTAPLTSNHPGGTQKDSNIKSYKRKASIKSKGKADFDRSASREKGIFNYYHTTHSIRKYLTDHLSDQQVDDLEEMAKCIYEAQLESLLPLDYKDLCFLEETVQRQSEFYETFLDFIGAPGAVWRRTGEILCCNDNFASMLKTTRSELVGANIVQLAAPEALYEAVKACMLKLALPNVPHQLVCDTTMLRRLDGLRLYMRAAITVAQNLYHMPSVMVGIFCPYATSSSSEMGGMLVLP